MRVFAMALLLIQLAAGFDLGYYTGDFLCAVNNGLGIGVSIGLLLTS